MGEQPFFPFGRTAVCLFAALKEDNNKLTYFSRSATVMGLDIDLKSNRGRDFIKSLEV